MNGLEALQLLKNGKKIRSKKWEKGQFIKAVSDVNTFKIIDEKGLECEFNINGFLTDFDSWEELKETQEIDLKEALERLLSFKQVLNIFRKRVYLTANKRNLYVDGESVTIPLLVYLNNTKLYKEI